LFFDKKLTVQSTAKRDSATVILMIVYRYHEDVIQIQTEFIKNRLTGKRY